MLNIPITLGMMLIMANHEDELEIETAGPCQDLDDEDFGKYAGRIRFRGELLVSTWTEFNTSEDALFAMLDCIDYVVRFANSDPW